jgi:hypothetical protein
MSLGVVVQGWQQPAPREFADGRCSAGETILESNADDCRRFFRRQHDLKTLGALTLGGNRQGSCVVRRRGSSFISTPRFQAASEDKWVPSRIWLEFGVAGLQRVEAI